MRFSDFLLVSDPADLDFIVGYADDQNIRIDVADFFADNISGTGNPGYIAFFTSNQTIGNSQLFQDGSNIVIGGVNAMGYRLAIYGGLYAANGASIQSTIPGSDTFRTIGEEGDSFIIPHDEDESIWTSRRIIHAPAVLTTESATLGQLNTAISNLEEDIDILLALKVDKTSVGVLTALLLWMLAVKYHCLKFLTQSLVRSSTWVPGTRLLIHQHLISLCQKKRDTTTLFLSLVFLEELISRWVTGLFLMELTGRR